MYDVKNGSIILLKINEKMYYNLVVNHNDKFLQTMPIINYNRKFSLFEDIVSILPDSSPIVELADKIVDFTYIYSTAIYTNHFVVGEMSRFQLRKILDCYAQYCLGNIEYSNEFQALVSKIESPENGDSENVPEKGHNDETVDERNKYNYDMIFINNFTVDDVIEHYPTLTPAKAKSVIYLSKVMNSKYLKEHSQSELEANYEKLIGKFKAGKMSDKEIDIILNYETYRMAYALNIPWTKEQEVKNIISMYRFNVTSYSNFKSKHNDAFNSFVADLTMFAYKNSLWFTMCDQRDFINTLSLDQFLKYYSLEDQVEYAEPLYWQILYKVNTRGSKNFHFMRFHSESEITKDCIVFIDGKKEYDYDKILSISKKYCIPYGYLYAKLSRIKEEKE